MSFWVDLLFCFLLFCFFGNKKMGNSGTKKDSASRRAVSTVRVVVLSSHSGTGELFFSSFVLFQKTFTKQNKNKNKNKNKKKTGKTSLCRRLFEETFNESYEATVEFDTFRKRIVCGEERRIVEFIDTGNQVGDNGKGKINVGIFICDYARIYFFIQESHQGLIDEWMKTGQAFLIVFSWFISLIAFHLSFPFH